MENKRKSIEEVLEKIGEKDYSIGKSLTTGKWVVDLKEVTERTVKVLNYEFDIKVSKDKLIVIN